MTDAPSPGAPTARRTDTASPAKARQRALRILYTADARGEDPHVTLDRYLAEPASVDALDELDLEDLALGEEDATAMRDALPRPGGKLDDFTQSLVRGVASATAELDRVITDVAVSWDSSRMAIVDRNILRLAVYELRNEPTPTAVVLDQAVELAKQHAGEDSMKFVNGILNTIAQASSDVASADLNADD